MPGGIFLIQNEGSLVELTEQPYEAEVVLQKLLADHPNILVGNQMNPLSPRRWLLVQREMAIPSDDGGSGRWALDHLFLDQDAVPTLVEVKRSSDSRIRREVVGQLLDYAANAVVYWPAEAIRAQFEATCLAEGDNPTERLVGFIEPGTEPEAFWQAAKTNLQAGRVRLVFVADVIPVELRRIVEFLNGQMNPAEVVAVEVPQFVGQGLRALTPRLVGQTAAAQQSKGSVRSAGKRKWEETSFMQELESQGKPGDVQIAREILDWAKGKGLRIWWGEGATLGSFQPMVDQNGYTNNTISVWTYGAVEVQFQYLAKRSGQSPQHPFKSDEKRIELRRRLNELPGVNIPLSEIAMRPSFPFAAIADADARRTFIGILDWLVSELRAE